MSQRHSIFVRIIDAFYRYRLLFLISLVAVTGTVTTILYVHSKTYYAMALTQVITANVAEALGQQPQTDWKSPAQKNVDHFNDLLNDDQPQGFVDTALTNAQLSHPISLEPNSRDPRLALLHKRLVITPQSDTTFSIELTWDNRSECQSIVEALRQQYINQVGLDREAQSRATTRFLDGQITDYARRLRQSEEVLIKYRQSNAGQLPEIQSADLSQLSSLQSQLDDMQITSNNATLKREALLQRIRQIKPLSIAEQTSTESPYQAKINSLLADRDSLLANGKLPNHPLVLAITQQIQEMEKDQQKKVRSGASEASDVHETKLQDNPEYQSLEQQLTDATIDEQTQNAQRRLLEQHLTQYEARVRAMPAAQRDLADKTRDYSILKSEYETLLQKREEARINGNLDKVMASSALSPIGRVYAASTTGKSKLLLMFIGSLFLGVVIGGIAIVLCEWADHSVRYEDDVERLLGIPALGTVPEKVSLRYLMEDKTLQKYRSETKVLPNPDDQVAKGALNSPTTAPNSMRSLPNQR